MTLFMRVLDDSVEGKAVALRQALHSRNACCFDIDPRAFGQIPGSPFAYWISSTVRSVFSEFPLLESDGRVARRTNGTTDDGRWIRAWWEISADIARWIPHAKGGRWAPYYDDLHLCIAWDAKRATYPGYLGTEHRPDVRPASLQYFFRPGLTWPRRTNGLSFRILPKGTIFGDKGPAIFIEDDDIVTILALNGICNSKIFKYLVATQLARTDLAQSFEAGIIQSTPLPSTSGDIGNALAALARRAWSLQRMLDVVHETSHAFLLPASLLRRTVGFDPEEIEARVATIQREIDDLAFSLYGITCEDRTAIEDGGRRDVTESTSLSTTNEADEPAEDETDAKVGNAEALLSWAVGVAFGRFDIRLAAGERAIPPDPEPLDPLPTKSPGMVPDGDPPFMLCQGVLVDDPGHADDLTARVTAVYERVGESAPEPDALRRQLRRDFSPTHIAMYSKSRRKAPIYWQLATPSASYSVWLHVHAFSKDTLFGVQTDYATLKLAHEQRQLEGRRSEVGPNPNGAQRKGIEAQEVFVDELQAFLDEVKRVAPLWNPDLDDGVIINFAPLWRLVPQHRTWQKELRATWGALANGDYDWAHLAMHLWPERVVPKCATDRSLAIAHNLEEILWVEDLGGRWRQRASIAATIRYLEETLPSVRLWQTAEELAAFSEAHPARLDGPSWWQALSTGAHDDTLLALALWPERVLTEMLNDPQQLGQLGLTARKAKDKAQALANLLKRYPPRHGEKELAVIGLFCKELGDRPFWQKRWADFHAGFLDAYALARFLYSGRVVAKSQDDHGFATHHDLARWFWIGAGSDARRLLEPTDEIALAIKERQSPAVKAALQSLLDAPEPGGGARRARDRSAR